MKNEYNYAEQVIIGEIERINKDINYLKEKNKNHLEIINGNVELIDKYEISLNQLIEKLK
jgi:hypothetical protein